MSDQMAILFLIVFIAFGLQINKVLKFICLDLLKIQFNTDKILKNIMVKQSMMEALDKMDEIDKKFKD